RIGPGIVRGLVRWIFRSLMQLLRIEYPAPLDHPPDGLRVVNTLERISFEQHNISELARRKGAQFVRSHRGCSAFSGQTQHLGGRESRFDKSRQLPVQRWSEEAFRVWGIGADEEIDP